MKFIRAVLILILLIMSRRYLNRWRLTTSRLSESTDAVKASLQRLDAMDNGGNRQCNY